jgi:hypothetical protein
MGGIILLGIFVIGLIGLIFLLIDCRSPDPIIYSIIRIVKLIWQILVTKVKSKKQKKVNSISLENPIWPHSEEENNRRLYNHLMKNVNNYSVPMTAVRSYPGGILDNQYGYQGQIYMNGPQGSQGYQGFQAMRGPQGYQGSQCLYNESMLGIEMINDKIKHSINEIIKDYQEREEGFNKWKSS